MKTNRIIILFLTAFFLQTTMVNLIEIRGFTPNLLLCATILLLLNKAEPGVVMSISLLTALLYDICFSDFIGSGAAAVLAVSATVITVKRILNLEDNLLPLIVLTAFETVLYNLIVWLCSKLADHPYGLLYVLGLQPFYILYNIAIISAFYLLFISRQKGRYRK